MRGTKLPLRYRYANMVTNALTITKEILDLNEPSKVSNVTSYEDADKWLVAIEEEIEFP